MQDLVVMFSFSVFIQKYLVRKIWRIHWYCSLLFHFDWTYLFWVNFVKKVKIVKLGRSLIPRLIWICRIKWWCSSFSVLDRKCFFSANLVQKIKLSFKLKFGTKVSPSGWGDPPDYPKNWLFPYVFFHCFGPKVLTL